MPWIPRGLQEGVVTSRYPRRVDGYDDKFRGSIVVDRNNSREQDLDSVTQVCPTEAISVTANGVQLDRGRCILCGRCTEVLPTIFQFSPNFENSVPSRRALVVPNLHEDENVLVSSRQELHRRVRALRRSIFIRHVDAGSDGAEEWEVAALTNPIYDVQRLGIFFTASPKHADLLLVTGVGSSGMLEPLRHTFEVMPGPKVVVAAGVDAISGGLVGEGYAAHGGISEIVPVDVFVPGSPPSPFGLLQGIMLAVGLLPRGRSAREKQKRTALLTARLSDYPPSEVKQ